MKYLFAISFFSLLLLNSCSDNQEATGGTSVEILSENFIDPPNSARPGAFWCWLNGNITRTAITRDLEEMKDKGMSRAEIWDVAAARNQDNFIPAGGAFLGDSSVALIKHALAEGERLGLKIGMIGSSGWNAGGPWVMPEWASKALFHSEIAAVGPAAISIELPFPALPALCPKDEQGRPLYYGEVAVLALPDKKQQRVESKDKIIDLTDHFVEGVLNCELPEGDWTILRFIFSNTGQELIVPSPNSGGLFIDFLDPQATINHLQYFMDRLGMKTGKSKKTGLACLEFDSMELDEGVPWTDSMADIFKKRRGYDLISYLPVLAGWSVGNETESFMYDWKKTISDQLIFSHYATGRRFLEKYGVELVAEAGGPGPPIWDTCPVDALEALGNVSIPRGEFWIRHRNMFLIKQVASASHIYGKKIVDAESFTTWRRWKDSPFALKLIVDRAFCEGLNCITFHTFANTNPEDGLPGRTYHAGVDINPATTWWEKSRPFMDYLSRCSYMLQNGKFVADVCYFYGDQAPNFYPFFHDVPEKPELPGLASGYDYDVVNSDVILNRMSVEDGRIVLPDGMSYSVMVLPDQVHMPLNVLKKLEQMVLDGATVIGPRPEHVPGLNDAESDNNELTLIVDRMWQGVDGAGLKMTTYGEGRIFDGLTISEVLQGDNIEKDFDFKGNSDLDFIHRQYGDGEAYFIRNEGENSFSGTCTFRSSGKYPEIWDPSTGKSYALKDFSREDGMIEAQMELDPGASLFVVFSDSKRSLAEWSDHQGIVEAEEQVEGPWKITFPDGWGAPAETTFDDLISWTESEQKGISYFSGTATYHKTLSMDPEKISRYRRIFLDLGEIRDVSEVFINGSSAGILWKKPYLADISDLLKAGDNQVEIEIVNLWVNRLTGDMLSEPGDRYCHTNHPYVTQDNWAGGGDETYRLQPAGLLGPVTIRYSE
ncbi:MAG: hypothetical protein GY790_08390 [Bacteroidetes bacterium]|nr:hypothetical protein [Bacteroidota bacterium]